MAAAEAGRIKSDMQGRSAEIRLPEIARDVSDCRRLPETSVIKSGMQAFKAANPPSTFADFVRWQSPHDWVADEEAATAEGGGGGGGVCHVRGVLSERMRVPGSSWAVMWRP